MQRAVGMRPERRRAEGLIDCDAHPVGYRRLNVGGELGLQRQHAPNTIRRYVYIVCHRAAAFRRGR